MRMTLKKILALESGTTPALVQAARALFYLLAVLWGALTVLNLVRRINHQSLPGLAGIFLTALMMVNALIMLGLGWGIGRQKRLAYLAGMAYLFLNIILTVTDEFGAYDLIVLVIAVGLLLLLVLSRKNYVR
jgi:hypothetical protein